MHDYRDIGLRALKTFAQGFVGVLVTVGVGGWEAIIRDPLGASTSALLVAACAAGIAGLVSWVWNYLMPPTQPTAITVYPRD